MPRRIFVPTWLAGSPVLKVDGECYTTQAPTPRPPDLIGEPGEYEGCEECLGGSSSGSSSGSGGTSGGTSGGGGTTGGGTSGGPTLTTGGTETVIE